MKEQDFHRDEAKRLLREVGGAPAGDDPNAGAIVATLIGIGHALLALEGTLQRIHETRVVDPQDMIDGVSS